jgi:hypothetical protein
MNHRMQTVCLDIVGLGRVENLRSRVGVFPLSKVMLPLNIAEGS